MRAKLIFLCLFLSFQTSFIFAELDSTSIWRADKKHFDPISGTFDYYEKFRNYVDGKVIINGRPYWKIMRAGYYRNSKNGEEEKFAYIDGYIRDCGDKWYCRRCGQEYLLHDFTLKVGDEVPVPDDYYWDIPAIKKIDSIKINGVYKKRFHLYGGGLQFAEYIIEDIGATSSLFEDMFYFEGGTLLICFVKDGESVWGEPLGECDITVDIEKMNESSQCILFPNPAHDYAKLILPPHLSDADIAIRTINQKIIYYKTDIATESVDIYLKNFSSGVYFIEINYDHNRQFLKLIKQ